MKILVTGATGFVGQALCQRLLETGHAVRCAIRGGEGGAALPAGCETSVVGSIGPETYWAEAVKGTELVIHLAARVHVMRESVPDPLAEFRKVNTEGTRRLAESAAAHGVKRLVYISTIKVNGEKSDAPFRESDRPAPQDPYGISKFEAESVLWEIGKRSGLEIVVIRPPLIYGPGVKANFRNLMNIVHRGVPLPFGTIRNHRRMVYLGNLVDIILCCSWHPSAAGEVFLAGDEESVSTPELVARIAESMGKKARLVSVPAGLIKWAGRISGKSAAVERLFGDLNLDIGKLEAKLGWKPPYDMKSGLRTTAEWFLAARS